MKILNEVLIRLPQCNSKLCQSEAFQKGSLPLISFIVNEIAFARLEKSNDPIENSKTKCLKMMTWSVLMSVGLIVKEKQGLVAASVSLGVIGGILVVVHCIGRCFERRKKTEKRVTLNVNAEIIESKQQSILPSKHDEKTPAKAKKKSFMNLFRKKKDLQITLAGSSHPTQMTAPQPIVLETPQQSAATPQPLKPPNTPASAPPVLPPRQQPIEPAISTQTTASAPVMSSAQKPPLGPSESTQSTASAPEPLEQKHKRGKSILSKVFSASLSRSGSRLGSSSISRISSPSSNGSSILSPNGSNGMSKAKVISAIEPLDEEGKRKLLVKATLKAAAAKTGTISASTRLKKFTDDDHQTIANFLLDKDGQVYIEGFFQNADLVLQKKVWLQLKEDSSKVWSLLPKDLKVICVPLDTNNSRLADLTNFPNLTEITLINSSVDLHGIEFIKSLLAKGIKVNLEQKNSRYFSSDLLESGIPESLKPKWNEQQNGTIARNDSLNSPFNMQTPRPSLMELFAQNEIDVLAERKKAEEEKAKAIEEKKAEEAKAKAEKEARLKSSGRRKHKHRTPK